MNILSFFRTVFSMCLILIIIILKILKLGANVPILCRVLCKLFQILKATLYEIELFYTH